MPVDPSIIGDLKPIDVAGSVARAQAQRALVADQRAQAQLRTAEAQKATGANVDPDQQLMQEILQETNGDISLIPGALAKRGHFKEAMEVLKGWDEHVKATTPPPQAPARPVAVQTMENGVAGTKFAVPQEGAFYPAVPKADNPEKAPNIGTFEDYVLRTYGDKPTSAQILQARKAYNQADDKATSFAAGDVTNLSPRAIDLLALNYVKTGTMGPMGMGDKANRQRVYNRAGELTPADITRLEASITDVAANKADYSANSKSLAALTSARNSIHAFEQTAGKNMDLFLAQAGKVVDLGSPLANRVARTVTGQLLGSPDQAAYDAARQVAINEVAKVTSNPTLSGQLSDAARKEVEAFNPASATLRQSVAVMRLLRRDMANRISSLDEEIAGVKGQIHTPSAAPAAAKADPLGIR